MAKQKGPIGQQEFIPSLEPEKRPKIIAAAKRYREERDKRIAANREESEAHDNLLQKMVEEGLDSYEFGDIRVSVDKTQKCKVSKPEGGGTEGGGE